MSEPVSDSGRTLHRYPETLVVAGLPPGSDVPPWAEASSILGVIATAAETTVVCAGRDVPRKVRRIGPFTGFAVEGPLEPELTGVLHGLLAPLAEAEISVFTLSTYSTDWVLVPVDDADRAAEEWRRRGHQVVPAPVTPPGKS